MSDKISWPSQLPFSMKDETILELEQEFRRMMNGESIQVPPEYKDAYAVEAGKHHAVILAAMKYRGLQPLSTESHDNG